MCSLSACPAGTKVVYLGDGSTQTMQLRETIKKARVWVKDSTGAKIPAEADLLDGGYYRNNLTK